MNLFNFVIDITSAYHFHLFFQHRLRFSCLNTNWMESLRYIVLIGFFFLQRCLLVDSILYSLQATSHRATVYKFVQLLTYCFSSCYFSCYFLFILMLGTVVGWKKFPEYEPKFALIARMLYMARHVRIRWNTLSLLNC